MNIIEYLNAIREPDEYLEKGYTENEIWDLLKIPRGYKEDKILYDLYCYAKVKVEPYSDIAEIKERFHKECDDYYSMMTVCVALHKHRYLFQENSFSWAVEDALLELQDARKRGGYVSALTPLEILYRKHMY